MDSPQEMIQTRPHRYLFGGWLLCLGYTFIIYSDFFLPWGSPVGGDIISLHLPSLAALQRSMLEGNPFPMWWREILCGVPAIPDLSATLLNPLYALLFFFSPLAVIKLQVVLCLLASGLGLVTFCRQSHPGKKEGKHSAPTHLLVMAFLGLMIFRGLLSFGHLGILSSVTLFIWTLVALQHLHAKASLLTPFPLGLAFGLSWLTGHPQFTVMSHELAFIWLLFHMTSDWKKNGRLMALFWSAVVLGAIIGSPQLYATFLHISETGRYATLDNQEFLASGSLNALHLFRWLFPFSFGEAQSYWGQFTFYMGLPWGHGLWLLFLLAGLKGSGWRLKAICLYIIIMAFGYQTFLYAWHQELVPGAKLFRFASRYVYMLIPFLMLLFYRGSYRIISDTPPKWLYPALLSLSLSSSLLFFFPLEEWNALPQHVLERASRENPASLWLLPLALSPLFVAFFIWKKKSLSLILICFLANQIFISVANPFSNVKLDRVPNSSGEDLNSLYRSEHQGGWRNLGLLKGELTIQGYSGLVPRPFRELVDTQLAQDFSKHNRLQLKGLPTPFLEEIGVKREGNKSYPMIRYANSFQPLDLRKRSDFSQSIQHRQQQLEKKYMAKFPKTDLTSTEPQEIRVLIDQSDSWKIETSSKGPGVLLFMENHHPLWKAWINGQETEIETWLGSFKALLVPAGEHTIEFAIPKGTFFFFLTSSILTLIVSSVLTFRRPKTLP